MTIKGLKQNERSLPRAGIIRLGYKTRYCTNEKCKCKLAYQEPDTTTCPRCKSAMGKQTTTESPHFILHDAPGASAALGTEYPTEIKVYFPFDDIERNFPSARTMFFSSYMGCQGDGQNIHYAVNPTTGQTVVKDGICLLSFTERMADGKSLTHQPGDKMPCPALDEPDIYAKCANCSNTGILLVLLEAVPTTAYFQISTHSRSNLEKLPGQMLYVQEMIYNLTGQRRLSGVPFILRRVLRSMTPIKKDKEGNPIGRMRTEKYVLQLEVEPEFMLDLVKAQRRLANPMAQFALPATVPQPTPQMDIIDAEPTAPQKPPFGFAEPPTWEAPLDEVEEEVTDPSPAPAAPKPPAPEPALRQAQDTTQATTAPTNGKSKKERPLNPADVYDGLHRRAEDDDGNPATKAQAGLVAGKLEECFAPGDGKGKRLTVLHWLWNVESAKELTFKQAKVTLDWLLLSGEKDSGGDYPLHPAASEEAQRIYHEAMVEAGQKEMPLEEAPELAEVDQPDLFDTEPGNAPRGGGAAYSD